MPSKIKRKNKGMIVKNIIGKFSPIVLILKLSREFLTTKNATTKKRIKKKIRFN